MSQPNVNAERGSAFESWRAENEERLEKSWREHLSYMQDSLEHIGMLAASDKAFEEWAYERYSDYCAEVRDVAADVESECEFEERTGGVSRTGDE